MHRIAVILLCLLSPKSSLASENQELNEFKKSPLYEEIKENFSSKLKEFKSSFEYDRNDEYTKRDILFGPTALEIKNPGNFAFCRSLLHKTYSSPSQYLEKFNSYHARFLQYDEDLEIWVLMHEDDAKNIISWYMDDSVLQSYCYVLGM